MRMGVAGGEDSLGLPGLDSKDLGGTAPLLAPSSWGDDGLVLADLCEVYPEKRGRS